MTIRLAAPALLALLVAAASPARADPSPSTDAAVAPVRDKVVRILNADDGKALFELYGPDMRRAFPLDAVVSFVHGAHVSMGTVLSTRLANTARDGATYVVVAQKGEWQLDIFLDGASRITGFRIARPAAPAPPVAQNDVAIGLPFRGRWVVFWGGDTVEANKHIADNSQRRAADLLGVDEGGRTSIGYRKTNADFLAWGREVLAVADGTVVTVVEGVPENVPGTTNPYMATGNLVILRHGAQLYSAYAHLQPGSARVEVGASVKRGEVLGLCGNTGNSSEPHLHFQLMDGPRFEGAWGVEAVFRDVHVRRDGRESVAPRYRFQRGDVIEAAGDEAHP